MSFRHHLYKDIRDRAVADTGSGGLFNSGNELVTGFFNIRAPAEQGFPLVVNTILTGLDASAFSTGVETIIGQFDVWCAEQPPSGATDPLLRLSQIEARLRGDWTTGTVTPSYGFHKFKPTLSGMVSDPWVASPMQITNTSEQHEEGMFHLVLSWELVLSNAP